MLLLLHLLVVVLHLSSSLLRPLLLDCFHNYISILGLVHGYETMERLYILGVEQDGNLAVTWLRSRHLGEVDTMCLPAFDVTLK